MRTTTAAVAIALLISACGGGDDTTAPTSTSSSTSSATATTTTTQALSPEEAFEADLRRKLTIGDGDYQSMVNLGSATCSAMRQGTEGVAEDDAPNDTPESDEEIGGVLTAIALSTAYEAFESQIVSEAFLRMMADNLCPEFSEDVESLIAARR